jgi:hypothetical protein
MVVCFTTFRKGSDLQNSEKIFGANKRAYEVKIAIATT